VESLDRNLFSNLARILYNLYHTHDLESPEYFNILNERLKYGSTGHEIEQSIRALEWAMEHKDYNFRDILPNISFSNEYILRFMNKYLNMLTSSFDQKSIDAMRVPLDERHLKILLVDNWQTGDIAIKLTDIRFDTVISHDIASGITNYFSGNFDIVILSLNKSPNDILIFLAKFREISQSKGYNQAPVLVLLNTDNNIGIEKLYHFGCNKHLFLPVPRYLLLQEIYKLTAEM